MVFVRLGPTGPERCGSVHPVSGPSTASVLVVERSTIETAAVMTHAQELSMPVSLCEASDASAVDLQSGSSRRFPAPRSVINGPSEFAYSPIP